MTGVHPHSAAAREELKALLSERARQVLAWFELHGRATDRECMTGLGFVDPNKVRPRISELIADGWLEEIDETRDPETGIRVRVVDLKRPPPALPLFQIPRLEESRDA